MCGMVCAVNISLASFLWDVDKQCRPDQMPQNAASDQGLHCLLTESSIKILIKNEKYNLTSLKTEMDRSN